MLDRTCGIGAAGAALLGLAALGVAAPAALADEAREKELEGRLESLEKELGELREQVRGGFSAGYSTELEARISQLEEASRLEKGGVFHYWDKGLGAASADKKFKFKMGGRIQNDYVFWRSHSDTEAVVGDDLNSGTEFRRARLFVSGTIHGNVEFKAEYDFAGGEVDFADVYIALKTKLGKVTVGHHYVPQGLESQTSSKHYPLMERGHQTALVHGRETGISLSDDAQGGDLVWAVGWFRDADSSGDDVGNDNESEWIAAARIAGRPYVDDDADRYVHLGASAVYDRFSDDMVRYSERPRVHQAPRFVDTDEFAAHDGMTYGLEGAYVAGPFHATGEYVRAEIDASSPDGTPPGMSPGDPRFDAWIATVGYFLTGETRPWKDGVFDRIIPKSNYDGEGGTGAWEVLASYSTIDLDDRSVEGGRLHTWVIGLNWYLNPNTRVMVNYVHADLDRLNAEIVEAVELRFMIDF